MIADDKAMRKAGVERRCFACATDMPEAECSHWVGVGWSCTDRKACRARRVTPAESPTPKQALDGLFNGAVAGLGGVHAAKLFNVVRADLDAKYSRDEHVAALEALEFSTRTTTIHECARLVAGLERRHPHRAPLARGHQGVWIDDGEEAMSKEATIIARMFVAKLRNEGAQFERSTLLIASELADILDGFRAADMTAGEPPESGAPFAVGDRVRMRSAELHALRGVGTIRAIDGDSATVGWDAPGGSTSVFHADIRRAVER